jgi:hypothetical protein
MKWLSIRNSKATLFAFAVMGLLMVLSLLVGRSPKHIPGTVTIRGGLSKSEAESLYYSTDRTLRHFYWLRIRAELLAGHLKLVWLDLRRGPERINMLSKEPDGHLTLTATNRLAGIVRIHSNRSTPLVVTNSTWQSRFIGSNVTLTLKTNAARSNSP